MVLRRITTTIGAVLLTLASPAAADEPAAPPTMDVPASGLRFGLRAGVALPFGSAFNGSGSLSDTITGYVPVRVDVGYRIERHFYVGVDAQLAAIVPAGCTSGFTCSGTNTRVGFMVAYHFAPTATFDPYVGVGAGYEVLHTRRSVDSASVDIVARGFELADLEVGGDVRLRPSWRIGPVLSGSLGRYSSLDVNGTRSTDYATAVHVWAVLGLRGAFDL